MRQISPYKLWLGNAGDLQDARKVMDAEIEAVVELADHESLATLPRNLIRCRFPLSDGGDNPPWLLRLAVESVATLLRAESPVLVCCSAGMSRSVCVAAGAIALVEELPLRDTLAIVTQSGPVDVSPLLFSQVQDVLSK